LVFATKDEAAIIPGIEGIIPSGEGYQFGSTDLSILVTGVGGMSTAWAMKLWMDNNPYPELAINAGIAGSYNKEYRIGDVVMPVTDCFADLGFESGEKIITLAESGLMNPDGFPFDGGVIHSRNRYVDIAERALRKVNAITVNTCSGTETTIEKLRNKFSPDIETMEGATFFYICAKEKIPFLSVRAISNKVEPRNRDSWDIQLALDNLREKVRELLLML